MKNNADDSEIRHGQIVTSLTSHDHGGLFLTKSLKAISVLISNVLVCSSGVRRAGGMAKHFNNVSSLLCLPDFENCVKLALSFKSEKIASIA